jgi:GcrA cell cycle regulator
MAQPHDARIRDLWFGGMSDAAIGAAVGLSAAEVLARRHELDMFDHGETRPGAAADADRPWPARDEELRARWAGGDSASVIAAAMGLTKNAVVGRAHRMGLPARPSPIIRDGVVRETVSVRVARNAVFGNIVPVAKVKIEPAAPVMRKGRSEPCCFPSGEPGKPDFRYCEAPSVPGRPYCAAHTQLAYAGSQMPVKTAEKIHVKYA